MEKKLKIGFFIDTFFPMVDGVIMVVDNYARRLSKFCDVTVFCPTGRKSYDDSQLPYKVVRCDKKLKLPFLDYDMPKPDQDKQFMAAVDNAQLDIVHIHSPFNIGKAGVRYAIKNDIPVVATIHSQFRQDFKRAVKLNIIADIMLKDVLSVFNSCTQCWAVNDAIANMYYDYGTNYLPKVQNNGTDIVPFKDDEQIKLLRQKYGIKDNEKVFLFIGRITALKNIFFIVKSLKILKEKGLEFKMLFVGAGEDEQKLKAKIKEYKLTNQVVMVGKVYDRVEISKYYKMADLFLFPSMYDASSLVQIEAASQATPTVFLKGSATAATVTDGVNGYLSANSTKAFAEKIIKIFEDEQEYKTISENAFKDLYVSWDDAVKKAYVDYEHIIENYKNTERKENKKKKGKK